MTDLIKEEIIATLHLICGLPCAGKTTLAKILEHQRSALRLSPDEWITHFYGADIAGEVLDAVRDPVENALWELAARVLVLGLDVILENGFWSKSERIEYREKAKQLGVRSELHFLNVPEEELLRRLLKRNTQLPPGAFWIDETRLRNWIKLFQPPDSDELQPWEV